jgi:hypothetical protein
VRRSEGAVEFISGMGRAAIILSGMAADFHCDEKNFPAPLCGTVRFWFDGCAT